MDSTVRTYLWQSKVHWPEREEALVKLLKQLDNGYVSRRIIDVGCGPGLLLPSLEELNFEYLGIDSEKSIIDYCNSLEKKSGITFLQSDLSNKEDVTFRVSDIVVLNGVAHHLDEQQFTDLIEGLRQVEHVILLDHYRSRDKISLKYFIPYVLQYLDKGKFVRNYEYFKELPGYSIKSQSVFPIKFMGIKLWDYFCHHYQSMQ